MRSMTESEPAAPGALLLSEVSEKLEGQDLTRYVGVVIKYGKEWNPVATSGIQSTVDHSTSDTNSIAKLLADKFSAIKGIESLFFRRDDDFYRVWVVIANFELPLEDQIYSAQMVVMDQLGGISFDFTVLARQGQDPGSIQPFQARRVLPSQ